jgi:hypothetical protein
METLKHCRFTQCCDLRHCSVCNSEEAYLTEAALEEADGAEGAAGGQTMADLKHFRGSAVSGSVVLLGEYYYVCLHATSPCHTMYATQNCQQQQITLLLAVSLLS